MAKGSGCRHLHLPDIRPPHVSHPRNAAVPADEVRRQYFVGGRDGKERRRLTECLPARPPVRLWRPDVRASDSSYYSCFSGGVNAVREPRDRGMEHYVESQTGRKTALVDLPTTPPFPGCPDSPGACPEEYCSIHEVMHRVVQGRHVWPGAAITGSAATRSSRGELACGLGRPPLGLGRRHLAFPGTPLEGVHIALPSHRADEARIVGVLLQLLAKTVNMYL